MELTAHTLKFQCNDTDIEIDLIDAALQIESFAEKAASAPDPARETLAAIKTWFKNDFDVRLSTSEAWTVQSTIDVEYVALKKKLSPTLLSAFGITSTPSNSRAGWLRRLFSCFRSSKRKEKSINELQEVISAQIVSGNL